MAEATTAKLVDEAIKIGLWPFLKEQGFKKKARNFHRELERVIQVVNIQSSVGTSSIEAIFTINLGVFFPAVNEVARNRHQITGIPKESQCTLRERLPQLETPHEDKWWRISTETDMNIVANEIADLWTRHGADWMKRCSELQLARDEAVRTGMLNPAIEISLVMGEIDRAEELFQEYLVEFADRKLDSFKEWGKKHGLGGPPSK